MHIYLSPHFDDAPLSCGGVIHQQRQRGEQVLVITVFAGAPPPEADFSPIATKIHRAMGAPDRIVAMRRSEDEAAVERLGARVIWLDFLDCIYRGRAGSWYYRNIPEIFGTLHVDEAPLAAEIGEAVRARVADQMSLTFYAPLTVGGHVDHQLVHHAAWGLKRTGWPVVFYEDYPYADPAYTLPFGSENKATLEATLAKLQGAQLTAQLIPLSEDDVCARIESVRAYASQLTMLFGGEAEMEERLRAFVRLYDPDRATERYWTPHTHPPT